MAGTVTYTEAREDIGALSRKKVVISWLSDGSGNATATLKNIIGRIERVVFDPGAAAPTALYDVTLTDEHGFDVLAGQGANLSDTVTSNIVPGVPLKDGTTTSVYPMSVFGDLALSVSNAGAAKNGTITLYLHA